MHVLWFVVNIYCFIHIIYLYYLKCCGFQLTFFMEEDYSTLGSVLRGDMKHIKQNYHQRASCFTEYNTWNSSIKLQLAQLTVLIKEKYQVQHCYHNLVQRGLFCCNISDRNTKIFQIQSNMFELQVEFKIFAIKRLFLEFVVLKLFFYLLYP